jgi:hypothetical protein
MQYASGLQLGPAAILNQNPIFETDSNKNLLFRELFLLIRIKKKVSIWVESGAVDDIEYTNSETPSGNINRARQTI